MNSFFLLSSALVSADPCTNGACGVPVNVSPLIAQGKIAEAKAAIHVTGIGMVCVLRFLSANTNTPSDTCGSSPVVVAIFHFHSNPLTPTVLPPKPQTLFLKAAILGWLHLMQRRRTASSSGICLRSANKAKANASLASTPQQWCGCKEGPAPRQLTACSPRLVL